MAGPGPDLISDFLEVEQCTSTAGTADVFCLGVAHPGALQKPKAHVPQEVQILRGAFH